MGEAGGVGDKRWGSTNRGRPGYRGLCCWGDLGSISALFSFLYGVKYDLEASMDGGSRSPRKMQGGMWVDDSDPPIGLV